MISTNGEDDDDDDDDDDENNNNNSRYIVLIMIIRSCRRAVATISPAPLLCGRQSASRR